MYNRLLNRQDLESFKGEIQKQNYPERFPHMDQWYKDDAILKYFSVLNEFQSLKKTNLKVVDLGCDRGCVPHIISSWGNDVTAIDLNNIDHWCTGSLVKMVLNDALVEMRDMEDASVDVFTDICAVTHFNTNYTDKVNNIGLKEVSDEVYRVLKNGGRFMISSDIDLSKEKGEFISSQSMIDVVESSGLKLTSKYKKEYENSDFYNPYNGMKLYVGCFVFEK
jgi:SAM-dependent methyltransferase